MPVTFIVLRRLYERIRKVTGILSLTNHVCRHTFVTRLSEKGVSAKAITQTIGHARTDYVLDIYARMEQAELCKAIYVLENQHDTEPETTLQLHFHSLEWMLLKEYSASQRVDKWEVIRMATVDWLHRQQLDVS